MPNPTQDDLFVLDRHDKTLQTRCRSCGRTIGNYFAARVSHGRAHVRKREAVEYVDLKGLVAFRLIER